MEKVFIEISQNSQENTCTRVSFLPWLIETAWALLEHKHVIELFKHSAELLKLLFLKASKPRRSKVRRGFEKLDRAFDRLGRVY